MNIIENTMLTNDEKPINLTSKFIVTRDELKEDYPIYQVSCCNKKSTDKKDTAQILLEVVFDLLNTRGVNK